MNSESRIIWEFFATFSAFVYFPFVDIRMSLKYCFRSITLATYVTNVFFDFIVNDHMIPQIIFIKEIFFTNVAAILIAIGFFTEKLFYILLMHVFEVFAKAQMIVEP